MSSSEPIRVAIQGELGSFSHAATLAILPCAEIVPCASAAQVFAAVQGIKDLYGAVSDVAVIPIENSLAGSVIEFYDLLSRIGRSGDVRILCEYMLRIRHNLIARPGTHMQDVRQVLSHPIALAQCRDFFNRNPHLQPVESYDTAGSVKRIMEQGNPGLAAIASKQAAEIYGGLILRGGIEDNPENYTRFLLLWFDNGLDRGPLPSERIPPAGAPNKMSLILTLKNQPGALVEVLRIFADLKMNLTKIESRPIQGRPWEYLFYVDVLFPAEAAADEALQRLRPQCETILNLGRYRAADPPTA